MLPQRLCRFRLPLNGQLFRVRRIAVITTSQTSSCRASQSRQTHRDDEGAEEAEDAVAGDARLRRAALLVEQLWCSALGQASCRRAGDWSQTQAAPMLANEDTSGEVVLQRMRSPARCAWLRNRWCQ